MDLFGIGDSAIYRMVVKNNVNLAIYGKEAAFEMSEEGDLFMLHIIKEGRVIYDDRGLFDRLSASFRYRNSYDVQIRHATDLGWALIQCAPRVRDVGLLNKRIAWCVRTLVVAKAASERKAIFSSAALADYISDRSVVKLIASKESRSMSNSVLKLFASFLVKNGAAQLSAEGYGVGDFLHYFEADGNAVGKKTMAAFIGEENNLFY